MTGFVFDADAALKRARESCTGPNLPNRPNRDNLEAAKLGKFGGLGPVRTSDPEKAPVPASDLPTHPPSCAFCGEADWGVAMTVAPGRRAHVRCAPSTEYWTNPHHERNIT